MTITTLTHSFQTQRPLERAWAVVPQGGAVVLLDDHIAAVAMDKLKLLRLQMESAFANCSNQKALELIARYEKEMQGALKVATKGLSSSRAIANYKQNILSSEALDQMKALVEGGSSLEEVIQNTFAEQLSLLDRTFPDELETYLQDTRNQLQKALDTKKEACQAQAKAYLTKLATLEKFLTEVSSVLPSYSIYGESLESVAKEEDAFQKEKNALLSQMQSVVDEKGIFAEIRRKLDLTQTKMQTNQQASKESLRKAISSQLVDLAKASPKASSSSLGSMKKCIGILKEVNQLYIEEMNRYLVVVTSTVNELVAGVHESVVLAMRMQDEKMEHFMKKSEALSEFLEYQTQKVLEMMDAQQKPVLSKNVGDSVGNPFDESGLIAHGRIVEIKVRSGCILDGLQLIYQDGKGRRHVGTKHGGDGGDLHTISLSPNEKIKKVVLGSGAFQGTPWGRTVEELTFHTNQNRTFGPYGGRGYPQGKAWLEHTGRLPQMKFSEIEFGPEYYLGAVKGSSSHYINSLAFVFFRDFSSQLAADFLRRLSAVVKLTQEQSDLKLSDEEVQQIYSASAQISAFEQTEDPYQVLRVEKGADETSIKKAYYSLCLQYHPDKIAPEEAHKAALYKLKLEAATKAYEALSKTH